MAFSFGRSLPVERPPGPLRGYKLAYAMLSARGDAGGFGGTWLSGQTVYQRSDTAVCFWSRRHDPPKRRCTCGFYCFDSLDAAAAMACESQYRSTVLLEVELSGRFIRYEHGFRYSNQRVVAVRLNRCGCGRPATMLADSGAGTTGWLQLQPCCLRCSTHKAAITPVRFGTLLGDPALMAAAVADRAEPAGGDPSAVAPETVPPSVSILTAEVALLQARVDGLEAELARLTR